MSVIVIVYDSHSHYSAISNMDVREHIFRPVYHQGSDG